MKRALILVTLSLLMATSAIAGQVFGRVKDGGRPIANVTFEIFCKDSTVKGTTDGYGAYSVNVGRGKCTFKLYYRNQQPAFEMFSYDSPLRYDFDVVPLKDGSLSLVRR